MVLKIRSFRSALAAGTSLLIFCCMAVGSHAQTAGANPVVNDNGTVNNASYVSGALPLAPGSIAAIFGANLTDGSSCLPPSCNPTFDNTGRLRTTMSGAQVTVNGTPVPIFYAAPGQLGIQVPTELTGTSATVQVAVAGQTSAAKSFPVGPFSPGLFSVTSDGKGVGAMTHANGTPVDAAHPAIAGETIIVYATGLGQVSPLVATGAVPSQTATTVTTPTVTIDGLPAIVRFSGLSGCCVGLNQINVEVPANVRASDGLSLVLSLGGQASNMVTLAARSSSPAGPITLSSVTASPLNLTGGDSSQGTVTLSASATAATTVSLSSGNTSVLTVPSSVTVAAGSSSAVFTITTRTVTNPIFVTITATANGISQMTTLYLTPDETDPYGY